MCNCDHSSLMERGPFVVMSMTYMPTTSADTLFVLCIFRSLILVHSFIKRWPADFLFLVRRYDDDSSTSSSSFWNHEPEEQYFYRFRRFLSSSTAEGGGRASFGDQTFPKSQSIFRTFFGVDYLPQQLGLVCEFEESP